MKALVFGAAPDPAEARPAPTDELETMLAGIPFAFTLIGILLAHELGHFSPAAITEFPQVILIFFPRPH